VCWIMDSNSLEIYLPVVLAVEAISNNIWGITDEWFELRARQKVSQSRMRTLEDMTKKNSTSKVHLADSTLF
jgi:hypothetical protein